MQLVDIRTFGTDPFQRLAPRPVDRRRGLRLPHPASAMQEVVALFLQHLLEAAAQHLDVAVRQRLDHQREGAVQHRIRGHELGPIGPRFVQIGDVRITALVDPIGRPELAKRSVQHATVPDVVEAHGRRGDVRLQAGRGDAPLRVAHPEQLLVVGEALDERVETQLSDSPGAHSRITASRGTIIISTQRSSS